MNVTAWRKTETIIDGNTIGLTGDPIFIKVLAKETNIDKINSMKFVVAPNPASKNINVTFDISGEESIQIDLYSFTGSYVRQLLPKQPFNAGSHVLTFDLNLPPAVYIFVLKGDHMVERRKLIIKN